MKSVKNNSISRAIVLCGLSPISARAVWSWLETGNEIAELWLHESVSIQSRAFDKIIGLVRPGWSVSAAVKKYGIKTRRVPIFSKWIEAENVIVDSKSDSLISCYHPIIVPENILSLFNGRAFNIHPSRLPRYRGAFPLLGMLLDETADNEGGVTIHVMTAGIDEGNIVGVREVPLAKDECVRVWMLKLARAVDSIIKNELIQHLNGNLPSKPQNATDNDFRRIDDDEFLITDQISARRIEWVMDTVTSFKTPVVLVNGKRYPVNKFHKKLGTVQNKIPTVRWDRVEFDCSDKRIVLKRATRWSIPLSKAFDNLQCLKEQL